MVSENTAKQKFIGKFKDYGNIIVCSLTNLVKRDIFKPKRLDFDIYQEINLILKLT